MNYVLNEEKMFTDITDGTAIIINSESGIYYGLNKLATCIYEDLINGCSIKSIAESIKSIENVPLDIETRLDNFISRMIKFEIILGVNGEDIPANINPKVAQEDDFIISVEEYTDAQELLLADPIHEVKEDIGWTPEKSSIGYTKEETLRREEKAEV